jgi:hypothetical protein
VNFVHVLNTKDTYYDHIANAPKCKPNHDINSHNDVPELKMQQFRINFMSQTLSDGSR